MNFARVGKFEMLSVCGRIYENEEQKMEFSWAESVPSQVISGLRSSNQVREWIIIRLLLI